MATDQEPTGNRSLIQGGLFRSARRIINPKASIFINPQVKASIRNIIRYYLFVRPVSDNWWYNAIGAPTNFGPALVLMKTGDAFGFDQATLDSHG